MGEMWMLGIVSLLVAAALGIKSLFPADQLLPAPGTLGLLEQEIVELFRRKRIVERRGLHGIPVLITFHRGLLSRDHLQSL